MASRFVRLESLWRRVGEVDPNPEGWDAFAALVPDRYKEVTVDADRHDVPGVEPPEASAETEEEGSMTMAKKGVNPFPKSGGKSGGGMKMPMGKGGKKGC